MQGHIGPFAWLQWPRRSRVLLVVKSGAAASDVVYVHSLCSQARADVALLVTTDAPTAAAQEAAQAAGSCHLPNGDVFPSLRVLTHADLRAPGHTWLRPGKLNITLMHLDEGAAAPARDWRLAL